MYLLTCLDGPLGTCTGTRRGRRGKGREAAYFSSKAIADYKHRLEGMVLYGVTYTVIDIEEKDRLGCVWLRHVDTQWKIRERSVTARCHALSGLFDRAEER